MADRNISSDELDRKKFLGFTSEDEKILRELQPFIEKNAPAIVDEFYEHIFKFDFLRTFYKDQEVVNRLKMCWREYLSQLFSGDYNKEYFNRRLRIGHAHEKAGLVPGWYLGAYCLLTKLLMECIIAEIGDRPERLLPALLALDKILNMDMQLAMDAYDESHHEAMEEANKKLEDYSKNLERKVEERTKELRVAEEKTEEYAKELEGRLRQLEEKGISRYDALIKGRNSYLIKEGHYERSLVVFSHLIEFGLRGLCLTTRHPDVLKETYNLEEFKGEFIWLSASGADENTINSSNLTAIHGKVNEFTKNNENSIVLFLGLEYIITVNEFEKSLKFLNSIIDAIVTTNSRLIVTIDPETLSPRELSLLEKSLIEIRDEDIIRLGLK